jgi:hypothetical protein
MIFIYSFLSIISKCEKDDLCFYIVMSQDAIEAQEYFRYIKYK